MSQSHSSIPLLLNTILHLSISHSNLSAMSSFHLTLAYSSDAEADADDEREEEEEFDGDSDEFDLDDPISSPLIHDHGHQLRRPGQFSAVAELLAALRRSFGTCTAGANDGIFEPLPSPAPMVIGQPTAVRHVAHVTFDRFDGFLGLPVELLPEVPLRVPSASVNVFGVSANSMQCSYDNKGNSMPTILISMQRYLYSQGGLQMEGIFRINADNSQELYVRDQLNKGIVPHGVDLHCLAGLIKAWFRELPTGVLDWLTPDLLMHCNSEEECSKLVRTLPPTEVALLDWAINLMADVVENEHYNKMNARNIAMVFAPNMTQMADPLSALIHAVQVMNLLKTLIMKTLREREEASEQAGVFQSCYGSPGGKDGPDPSKTTERESKEKVPGVLDRSAFSKLLFSAERDMGSNIGESFRSFEIKSEADEDRVISGKSSHFNGELDALEDRSRFEYGNGDSEDIFYKLSFKKGLSKLCRHPVFHLSKRTKNSEGLGIVNSTEDGREIWT